MSKGEKTRFIYGICFAALTIVVGLIFIIEIADLYYSAIKADPSAPPYTVENIGAHLTLPIVFLCIWIAAIVAGFVLSLVFHKKESKSKIVNDERTLALLKARVPGRGAKVYDEAVDVMGKYETFRLMSAGVTLCVLLCCAVYILFYVFNPQNFHADGFKSDIMELVRTVLIWMALGFVSLVLNSIVGGIAVKAEIEQAKIAISSGEKNSGSASIKPNLILVALKVIMTLAIIALMLLVIFVISPSALNSFTGNTSKGFMQPVFILIGLAVAIAVYILVERLSMQAKATSKRTQLLCTVAASVIAAITVVLYIVAPPLLTMIMTKLSGSVIYFVLPALIVIIAGFVLYRTTTKLVPQKTKQIMLIATRVSIGIVAVSFIIAGITNGGANDVLLKAINICTECIGLG